MTANHEGSGDGTSVDDLKAGIKQTRRDMSETLVALEERLSPDVLGEKAREQLEHLEARMKTAMKEGIDEAKEAVTHGLKEARDAIKNEVNEAIAHTKESVREATLGRVETFATQAGDVMNDTRDTLVETIRQNPIPAALAGVGIAWLLMNRSTAHRSRARRERGYPYGYGADAGYRREGGPAFTQGMARSFTEAEHAVARSVGNAASRVGELVGQAGASVAGAAGEARTAAMGAAGQAVDAVAHVAHDARDAAGRAIQAATEAGSHLRDDAVATADHLTHQARDAAAHATELARREAARVESSVASAWEANPLAFGAAALLAGAAMGYALPRTKQEDELVGDLRDRVVHRATAVAGQAVQSLEHMAEDAGKAAKDAASAAHS